MKKEIVTSDIKVTIHIPENVSDRVKQLKINQIYDILVDKKE